MIIKWRKSIKFQKYSKLSFFSILVLRHFPHVGRHFCPTNIPNILKIMKFFFLHFSPLHNEPLNLQFRWTVTELWSGEHSMSGTFTRKGLIVQYTISLLLASFLPWYYYYPNYSGHHNYQSAWPYNLLSFTIMIMYKSNLGEICSWPHRGQRSLSALYMPVFTLMAFLERFIKQSIWYSAGTYYTAWPTKYIGWLWKSISSWSIHQRAKNWKIRQFFKIAILCIFLYPLVILNFKNN